MPKKSIDWTVPGILGGLAGVLWLLAAMFYAFFSHLAGRVERVESWPTTEALVLVNHWETYQGKNPNTGKFEPMPILRLEYSYEVGGESYKSDKGNNIDGVGGGFDFDAYPVGSRLPIRYDPDKPSISGAKMDLQNEMNLTAFFYPIGGLTLIGLVLFGFALRSWLRQRAATV